MKTIETSKVGRPPRDGEAATGQIQLIVATKTKPNRSMKTQPQNRLAIFHADWKQFPTKPISLLEIMQEIEALQLFELDSLIEDLLRNTKELSPAATLSKEKTKTIYGLLHIYVEKLCQGLGWKEAERRREHLKMLLDTSWLEKSPPVPKWLKKLCRGEKKRAISAKWQKTRRIMNAGRKLPKAGEVHHALEELQTAIKNEISSRKFVMIDNHKADFLENANLFGKKFHASASQEINSEIKATGNCLALELNTDAVFHSIRAAEMGMRRLASRLNVVVYREKKKYRIKIEDASWQELITGIKDNIKTEKEKPPADRKIIKSHFRDYDLLADQLNRLKDDRNEVMHTKGDFTPSAALAVVERVKDFMLKLVTKISLK